MAHWLSFVWKALISFSILIIIITLFFEFFLHVSSENIELIRNAEIFALSFLFVELLYNFISADNKREFVKKEWLLILSFLPFGAIFRFLRVVKTTKVFVFLSGIWLKLVRFLKLESLSVKTAQSVVHSTKAVKAVRPIAQIIKQKDNKKSKK